MSQSSDTQENSSEYETESLGPNNEEDIDLSEIESSLSDEDEYFEDDLIVDEPVNQYNGGHSPPISSPQYDQTLEDVNFEWTTGYTTRWRQSARSFAGNNNHKFPMGDLLAERSKSEINLYSSQPPKKRLSVDLSSPSHPPSNSLFKSIGNWFRGDTRSTASKLNKAIDESESGANAKQPITRTKSVVGTDFSSVPVETEKKFSNKKVLKFDEDSFTTSDDESSDAASETSSTESSSKQSKFRSEKLESIDSYSGDDILQLDITFKLISTEQSQCLSWRRQFRKLPRILVENKKLNSNLVADALVVPGNSFGLLDGWPEIEYIKLFGWGLQRQLRKEICDNFDGELLVGQAIVISLPLSPLSDDVTSNDVIGESEDAKYETNCCHGVKKIVYAPVMRVPIDLKDSVNAYLAFKASICAVKRHNAKSPDDDQIKTVVCPALCSDLGMMPPSRIALQMRTAYEAYVLSNRPKISVPNDLGYLATNHVELTTAKTGGWC